MTIEPFRRIADEQIYRMRRIQLENLQARPDKSLTIQTADGSNIIEVKSDGSLLLSPKMDRNLELITSGRGKVIYNGTDIEGGLSGSGTANKIAKFSTPSSIIDSIISDNGSIVSISGELNMYKQGDLAPLNFYDPLYNLRGTIKTFTGTEYDALTILSEDTILLSGDSVIISSDVDITGALSVTQGIYAYGSQSTIHNGVAIEGGATIKGGLAFTDTTAMDANYAQINKLGAPTSYTDAARYENGIILCDSTTRPSSPFEGMHIYETDTDRSLKYNGSSWVEISGVSDHGSLTGLSDDDHTQYYNSTRHTKSIHDSLGIDADTVDGSHAVDFALAAHNHDAIYIKEGTMGTGTYALTARVAARQDAATPMQYDQTNGLFIIDTGAIVPGATDTCNIGDPDLYWQYLYLSKKLFLYDENTYIERSGTNLDIGAGGAWKLAIKDAGIDMSVDACVSKTNPWMILNETGVGEPELIFQRSGVLKGEIGLNTSDMLYFGVGGYTRLRITSTQLFTYNHIIPGSSIIDIGSASAPWQNLYIGLIFFEDGGSIVNPSGSGTLSITTGAGTGRKISLIANNLERLSISETALTSIVPLEMSATKITGLANPTNAQDAATKAYVDASAGGSLVKVSPNDITAGYLNGKLIAGTNIQLTENNDGSDETLTIATITALNADTVDGSHAADFALAVHDHDTIYIKEGTIGEGTWNFAIWAGTRQLDSTSALTYDGSTITAVGKLAAISTDIYIPAVEALVDDSVILPEGAIVRGRLAYMANGVQGYVNDNGSGGSGWCAVIGIAVGSQLWSGYFTGGKGVYIDTGLAMNNAKITGLAVGTLSDDAVRLDQLITDHGALTGLADDDHSQYLLTSAGTSRKLSGNLYIEKDDPYINFQDSIRGIGQIYGGSASPYNFAVYANSENLELGCDNDYSIFLRTNSATRLSISSLMVSSSVKLEITTSNDEPSVESKNTFLADLTGIPGLSVFGRLSTSSAGVVGSVDQSISTAPLYAIYGGATGAQSYAGYFVGGKGVYITPKVRAENSEDYFYAVYGSNTWGAATSRGGLANAGAGVYGYYDPNGTTGNIAAIYGEAAADTVAYAGYFIGGVGVFCQKRLFISQTDIYLEESEGNLNLCTGSIWRLAVTDTGVNLSVDLNLGGNYLNGIAHLKSALTDLDLLDKDSITLFRCNATTNQSYRNIKMNVYKLTDLGAPTDETDSARYKDAIMVCSSTGRPTSPTEGMHIYETDTDKTMKYTGVEWIEVGAGTGNVVAETTITTNYLTKWTDAANKKIGDSSIKDDGVNSIEVGNTVIPYNSSMYDLGNSDYWWKDLYCDGKVLFSASDIYLEESSGNLNLCTNSEWKLAVKDDGVEFSVPILIHRAVPSISIQDTAPTTPTTATITLNDTTLTISLPANGKLVIES